MRKELFDNAEAKTARESKSKTGYTKKIFSILWYPVEWEVFMIYGIGSQIAADAFMTKESNGPSRSSGAQAGEPVVSKKRKNRREQRHTIFISPITHYFFHPFDICLFFKSPLMH